MKVLLLIDPLAERETGRDAMARLVQAASPLSNFSILLARDLLPKDIEKITAFPGVNELILVEHPALVGFPVESYAALVVALAGDFSHIVASTSSFGASVLPRIAALLNIPAVTGVVKIVDATTFIRPVQAGNFLATVQTSDPPVCLTLRTSNVLPAKRQMSPTARVKVLTPTVVKDLGLSRLLETIPASRGERPDLASARIVVAGGGGLEQSPDFSLMETLAEVLDGAVGASRAAVDAELAPSAWQIGQTGQIIAPDLYVGVGISGAIQHLAGIKEAKTIVAINSDTSAPLLAIADVGLVADLYEAVPELIQTLRERKRIVQEKKS